MSSSAPIDTYEITQEQRQKLVTAIEEHKAKSKPDYWTPDWDDIPF